MFGPKAKDLAKFKMTKPGKEFIDIEGFYEDGQFDASRGIKFSTGSLKLKENIEAYTNGYKDYINSKK